MQDRIHKFVQKYHEALKFYGRGLNGLERAALYNSLKESGAEEIFEMLETITQHEEVVEAMKIPFAPAQMPPNIVTVSDDTSGGIQWDPDRITTGGYNQTVIATSGTSK